MEASESPTPSSIEGLEYPRTTGIELLHRHDGYISLAVKSEDGRFAHLASVQRGQLDSVLPLFRERLEKDSFVGINASYKETNSLRRSQKALRKYHSTQTLKYLCASYADIDYYKLDLTFNQAFFLVLEAAREKRIPPPSIVIDSGRGMWLLWLLIDPKNSDQAHCGAWDDNPLDHALLYSRIQREICRALSPIGCDPAGTDAARHLRIEGSFHTGADKYVAWWIQMKGPSVYTYTLKGLADFFGIDREPSHHRAECASKLGRAKGHRAAGETKVRVIEWLFLHRRGFAEGQRNVGLFLYAMSLRGAHFSPAGIMERVMNLARDCKVSRGEVAGIVRSVCGKKQCKLKYQTIADRLSVTPDEAEEISLLTNKPFPPAAQFPNPVPTATPKQGRREERETRRATIRLILQSCGGINLSFRDMQKRLAAERIVTSQFTVREDYAAMGIESEETRKRRIREDLRSRQALLVVP